MNEPSVFGYGVFLETIYPTDVMLLYIAAEHPEQLGEPITRPEMAAIADKCAQSCYGLYCLLEWLETLSKDQGQELYVDTLKDQLSMANNGFYYVASLIDQQEEKEEEEQ